MLALKAMRRMSSQRGVLKFTNHCLYLNRIHLDFPLRAYQMNNHLAKGFFLIAGAGALMSNTLALLPFGLFCFHWTIRGLFNTLLKNSKARM